MEEEQLRERCRQIAQQVLADRGWGLVQDEGVFVEEVLAEVRRRRQQSKLPLDKVIKHATVNRYCHLLHTACQSSDVLRQRRALRELYRYLYRVALYRANGDEYIAEESAQEALVNIWRALENVVDPGSFLGFARITVSREVTAQFEKRSEEIEETDSGEPARKPREIPEADLTFRGGVEDADLGAQGGGGRFDPAARQGPEMTDEMRDRLEAAIRECLDNEQQQEVVIGMFFDEASGKEMAGILRTTPAYVYVLKHRAVEYLRECEEFLVVLEDLL